MIFSSQLFLFSLSGLIGFIIDTATLYAFKSSLGLYISRIISFACAAIATWIFNRSITFKNYKSGISIEKEFIIYILMMTSGGIINYTIYAILITNFSLVEKYPFIGIAAGSLSGLAINLSLSKFLLFRKKIITT